MRAGSGLFAGALGLLFLSAGVYFFKELFEVWKIYASLFFLLAAADFVLLRFFTAPLSVRRDINKTLFEGQSAGVVLTLNVSKKLSAKIKVFDIYDDSFDCDVFPLTVKKIKNECVINYSILPVRRGDWIFPALEILYYSLFRFWRRKIRYAEVSMGRTYPFLQFFSRDGMSVLHDGYGEKHIRARGVGLEFESLREWRTGDSKRIVDWRATARRGQVIVRNYIEEEGEHILILLDSGYRLHRREDAAPFARTQFDFALVAALSLCRLALNTGDSVSLGVSGVCEKWLPEQKGKGAFASIMNALYGVHSTSAPSSLFQVLERALAVLKRRTFIIFISNFREEDEEELAQVLPKLQRRHLLLMVSLCEREALLLAKGRAAGTALNANDEGALIAAAASHYIEQRKKLYKKWRARGLLTLDTDARSLSASLINKYTALKKSGVL